MSSSHQLQPKIPPGTKPPKAMHKPAKAKAKEKPDEDAPSDASRWALWFEAIWWRSLMQIGMWLHRIAPPRPLKHKFTKQIDSTISSVPGKIRLYFYTPTDYGKDKMKRYPCIINFHGGGFTLGDPRDDARWCTAVVNQTGCVVVSVDYRRAPEHPFPTAVEDGADSVMFLWDHASEFLLDADKFGVSGFSAGGNMSITVPLRLQDVLLRRRGAEPPTVSSNAPVVLEHEHKVVKIVLAFYPTLDYTKSRKERAASNPNVKELPHFFTKLFDASYLHPPSDIIMSSPFLSPGAASDDLLSLLPEDIMLYTCEYDELLDEGIRFRDRIIRLGKNVKYKMITKQPHAWDKSPNPLHEDPQAVEVYKEACDDIKRLFAHSR